MCTNSISLKILLPLQLSAGISAADAAIPNKNYGSGTTALIVSNEEINDVMKIVKSFFINKRY